ncbi:TIGR04255 family protein [Alcaligenes faecalis]|nr:TIGR04255 family protein [Alcaligenes faecalis]
MSRGQLPTMLQHEVLVDVVFELRFAAQQGFSDLVPGGARGLFGPVRSIEKTPVADIPHQMREIDPNLQYQPTMRMVWDDVVLLIGDRGIGIGFGSKYPGWSVFKSRIDTLLNWISDAAELASMVQKVHRYAFKYVDFIPEKYSEGIENPYRVSVAVGGESMDKNSLKIQIEKKEEFGTVLFDFSHPVQAQIENKPIQIGTLVSIDAVRFFHAGIGWDEFREDFSRYSDLIHQKNKEYFFNTLSDAVLERLEPKYE